MYLLGFVAWIVVVIAIAFWPARIARRKGYSYLGFFIFSFFLFPVALVVVLLAHDRNAAEHQKEQELADAAPEF